MTDWERSWRGGACERQGGEQRSITDLEEPEKWAVKTFGQAEWGDVRRTDRLVQRASALASNPQASLPTSVRGETETVGASRLLNHAARTPEAIQMPHCVQTRDVAATRSQVLMMGETTEGHVTSHRSLTGAEPGGRGSKAQGLFLSRVLARDAQMEELLGCISQHRCVRQPAPEQETRGEKKRRARESQVWEQSVRGIGPVPQNSQWIHVGDRGSDLFPLWHACRELGDDCVTRIAQDRRVRGEESERADDPALLPLKSRARQLPGQDLRLFSLPATDTHSKREAVVMVRVEAVRIQPPLQNATRTKTEMALWVVRVWKPLPPPGVEPIAWLLVTSVPVLTVEDAWERVRWSRCRWLIEAFHTVLKSGCRFEDRRMHPVTALQNLLAILTPIPMRLLLLRQRAVLSPDLPVTQFVSEDVVQVVALLDQQQEPCTTVRSLCCSRARFGGFLARTCDGLPGWQTLCVAGSLSTLSCSAFILRPSSLLLDFVSKCQFLATHYVSALQRECLVR